MFCLQEAKDTVRLRLRRWGYGRSSKMRPMSEDEARMRGEPELADDFG